MYPVRRRKSHSSGSSRNQRCHRKLVLFPSVVFVCNGFRQNRKRNINSTWCPSMCSVPRNLSSAYYLYKKCKKKETWTQLAPPPHVFVPEVHKTRQRVAQEEERQQIVIFRLNLCRHSLPVYDSNILCYVHNMICIYYLCKIYMKSFLFLFIFKGFTVTFPFLEIWLR